MTGYDVVAVARGWIGTRWQHQASIRGVASDCIGLIAGVAAELGVPEAAAWAVDRRRLSYGRRPDPAMLLGAADDYLCRVPVREATFGDVLLLRFRDDPQHFGIVSRLAPMYLIHAYAGARRVVENRVDELWASRIVRAYRFRGL